MTSKTPELDDPASRVLLEILEAEGNIVPEALILRILKIQQEYQYDKDRDLPLDRIRRAVEEEVSRRLSSTHDAVEK